MSIGVVIVDDHAVFRGGLRALLDRVEGIVVVGEAATTDEAITTTRSARPDVVLMDLHLPGAGGIHATAVVRGEPDPPAVLVLTMSADDALVRQALTAGAHGYLLKDAEPDSIIRAILALGAGQLVFDAAVADTVLSQSQRSTTRPFPSLTPREFDVLERLADGLSNDAIAGRLGISRKSVQNIVSAVYLKIGARDRGHAVSLARDAGVAHRP